MKIAEKQNTNNDMGFAIKDNENNKIISSAKTIDELSDGYHTFKELYDFRREYNIKFCTFD